MASFYGTAVGFLTYCEDRGITSPTGTGGQIEGKLLVASEWIDTVNRTSFPGTKTGGREQEREWPRTDAYDIHGYDLPNDEVPREVEYATYEAALIELNEAGALSTDYKPSKYTQATVQGAVSVTYAKFDSWRDAQVQYAKVIEWLSPILIQTDTGLVGSVHRV